MKRADSRRLILAAVTLVTAGLGLSAIPAFADPGTGAITGHLTDGDNPVTFSTVIAYTLDSNWAATTSTDETGAYRLADLAPGQYKVGFNLPGSVSQYAHQTQSFDAAAVVDVLDGQDTTVDEQVMPHGSLGGRVTTATGDPAASVSLVAYHGFDIVAQGQTDPDGNYLLPFVPAGGYKLQFQPPGAPEQFAHRQLDLNTAQEFTVTVGQRTTVDETLFATGTVRGHLTRAGAPVAGALMSLEPTAPRGSSVAGPTGEDGAFSLAALPGPYRLFIQLPSGLTQYSHGKRTFEEADLYTVTAGGEVVIEEETIPTGTVTGRLTDQDGNPVSGAGVTVTDPTTEMIVTTDGDGRYTADVLPGTYKVRFEIAPGRAQWAHQKTTRAAADQFAVAPGATVTVDDQALRSGVLQVTAHDAKTGAAIASFCAGIGGAASNFACTEDGTAVFAAAGPGTYEVSTYPTDPKYLYSYITGVVVSSDQTTTVDLRHALAATIDVTVRDRRTGAPVENVCVTAVDVPSHAKASNGPGNCSDGTGKLRIDGLPASTYNLFVRPSDFVHGYQWMGQNGGTGMQSGARDITLRAGDHATLPAIKLDRAGSISGIVTDKATGTPLDFAFAGLNMGHPGAGDGFDVFTDANGRYTFGSLGPYEWPMAFGHSDYALQWSGGTPNSLLAKGIKVREGATTTFNVGLTTGVTITGTVATAAGVPVVGGFLTAVNVVSGGIIGFSQIDANGHYTLHLLTPQLVRLRYEGMAGDTWYDGWYVDAADFDHATPVLTPLRGSRTINIVATRTG